jgi:hypothetical protein
MVTDTLERAGEAIRGLDPRRLTNDLLAMSPAIAGLGAAGIAAGAGMSRFTRFLVPGGPLVSGIAAFALAVPEVRDGLGGMLSAVAPLAPPLAEVAGTLSGLFASGLASAAELLGPAVQLLGLMVEAFTALPGPLQSVTLALGALGLALKLSGPVGIALAGLAALGFAFDLIRDKTQDVQINTQQLADTMDQASGAITDQARALAFSALEADGWLAKGEELGINSGDLVDAFLGEADALAFVRTRLQELIDVVPVYGEETRNMTEAEIAAAIAAEQLHKQLEIGNTTVDEAREMIRRAGEAGIITAGQMEVLEEVLDGVTVNTSRAAEALGEYASQLRGIADPMFGLISALQDVDAKQRAYNDAVDEYGANSAEAESASLDLLQSIIGADAAAHNAELSFGGMNQVIDDMHQRGLISAETAGILKGAIDTARESAEDYTGPYVADLQAEIDDPKLRDAKRRLDAIARVRSPRYRAELDRQAEIQARNRLAAMAAPRRAPITPYLTQSTLTVQIRGVGYSGSIHTGGRILPTGQIQHFHDGGPVLPRYHTGSPMLRRDEVPAILQTGEIVLSRPQAAAFDTLMTTTRPAPSSAGRMVGAMERAGASRSGGGSSVLELRVTGSGSLYEQIKAGVHRGELALVADGKQVRVR